MEAICWLAFGIVFISAWGAAGVVAAGLTFAYFQREWPELAARDYESDRMRAWATAVVFGPCALLAALTTMGTKHGLKFR